MSIVVTGQKLLDVIVAAHITVQNAEVLLDQAIGLVESFSKKSLPLLSGSAGSKSASMSSPAAGVVLTVAKILYQSNPFDTAGVEQAHQPAILTKPVIEAIEKLCEPLKDLAVEEERDWIWSHAII